MLARDQYILAVLNFQTAVDLLKCQFPLISIILRIPRYPQRLRTLFFIKTCSERVAEIQPKVEDLIFGCDELANSQKLKKVLEIVLALGNAMNRGNRGNAYAFKLSCLNRMVDTKSSVDKDMTLLHYVIKTLENQVCKNVGLGVGRRGEEERGRGEEERGRGEEERGRGEEERGRGRRGEGEGEKMRGG